MRTHFIAPLVALAAAPIAADAQLGTIAAGATIGTLVSELENSVKNSINRADDAVSNNGFRIRQHGEILLSQLNAIAADQRDKTFAQLNDTQQRAFLNIKNSIDQLAQLQRVTAADVQRTTNTVGTAMANLPLGKTIPRIIDFGPAYVVGRAAAAPATNQTVSVSGMTLGEGTPKLRMQGAECALLAKTEISLKFSCPTQAWSATSGVGAATGELQVFQKPGFWGGLFGGKPKARPYKVSVFVVPPEMGQYSLAVTRKVVTQETNVRSQDFRSDNGHCDGDREVLFPFNVTPGWTIDPASIRPDCNRSDKSSCSGLRNVTATSFGYLGVVRNSGECVKVLGKVVAKDARGNVRGNVTWTETRPKETVVTEPAGQGGLQWGRAVQLPLPSAVQAISLTIDQLDGKRVIVTGNDLGQRWYTVQSDPVNSFVLISPRSLDQAMAY